MFLPRADLAGPCADEHARPISRRQTGNQNQRLPPKYFLLAGPAVQISAQARFRRQCQQACLCNILATKSLSSFQFSWRNRCLTIQTEGNLSLISNDRRQTRKASAKAVIHC